MGKWTERYLPDSGGEFSRMHASAVLTKPSKPGSVGFDSAQVARIQKIQDALTATEEQALRRWLSHIEEADPAIIAEVLDKCRDNAEARAYFLHRAGEVPPSDPDDRQTDDRNTCRACRHLRAGYCTAKRHGIEGEDSFRSRPHPDRPRRCAGFVEASSC